MGELQIQQNSHADRFPVWRKILTLTLFPAIIFVWTTGWILTEMGSQWRPTKIKQKTMINYYELEADGKESRMPDEDSRIAHEPEIIA